jgi:hypothetical protein
VHKEKKGRVGDAAYIIVPATIADVGDQPLPFGLFVFIFELPVMRFAFGGEMLVTLRGIDGGTVELLFII